MHVTGFDAGGLPEEIDCYNFVGIQKGQLTYMNSINHIPAELSAGVDLKAYRSKNANQVEEACIDNDAMTEHSDALNKIMVESVENVKENGGVVRDYHVTIFKPLVEYPVEAGGILTLYSFDYAVEVEDPNAISLAGAAYIDEDGAIRGLSAMRPFFVLRDGAGQIIRTGLAPNDSWMNQEALFRDLGI